MRALKVIGLATVLALGLVACGGSEEAPDAAPKEEAPSEPDENRVEIGMTEYAYGMPETIEGGNVTLDFTNNGEIPHEAAFGVIGGGHDEKDALRALERNLPAPWFKDLAGIPVLDAGASASMTRDLEPGLYSFFCFLPVPGKGAPHLNEGMVQFFEVEGTSAAAGPTTDLQIIATDDGFDVPEIAAGEQTIELVNEGSKAHEFAIFGLEPGKSLKDIDKWFGSGFETDKPAVFPGGMQSIKPGTSVVVEMTFESGRTYLVQDFENKLEAEFTVE
jgi:hypothetical protein